MIKCIKLVSAEFIIAETEVTEDNLLVEEPVIMGQDPNTGRVLLIDYVPHLKKKAKLTIPKTAIIYI